MTPPVSLSPELAAVCRKWEFVPTEQLPSGHCSHIYANDDRVLKVPFRGEELTFGARAAVFLSTHHAHAVPILEYDPDSGCQLMPRLRPGTNLADSGLSPGEQTELAISMMRAMPAGEPDELLLLSNYEPNPCPEWKVLIESCPRAKFLHGDLHHFNILLGQEWTLIDPKGLWGDPAFEPVAFLRNPIPQLMNQPDLQKLQRERIHAFAKGLNLDAERILAWHRADLNAMSEDELNPSWRLLREVVAELTL